MKTIRWVLVVSILLSLSAGAGRALADGWTMPRWMPFAKKDSQGKSPTIKKRARSAEKGPGKGLALKKPQMVTDLQNNTKKLISNGKNMLTLKKTGRTSGRSAPIKKDKSVPKSTGEWMALPQVKP